MEPHKLSDDFTVSPQIDPADIATLAQMGYRTLINNRPDTEVPDSHSSDVMAEHAAAAGLAYHYLPYFPGMMTPELIAAYEDVMAEAETPAFAYCRSGTRSSHLWGIDQAGRMPVAQILEAAAQAGYDHAPLVPLIEMHAANRKATG
ncbi:TIGR01244 family phosphatase [Thioclava sp. BHET1]|nr:TIGR01244 family phosphatase [Thioclava sp. BHET1]